MQPLYGDHLLVDQRPSGTGYERQLSERLRQQQRESEEDSKWLQEEEINLKKRLSVVSVAAAGILFFIEFN